MKNLLEPGVALNMVGELENAIFSLEQLLIKNKRI